MSVRTRPMDLPPLQSGSARYRRAWRRGWAIPDRLPVDEWAERYRILPRESSSEPGRFRVDRAPFVREILRCLSHNDPAKRVVWMASTQVTKTETGNNWIGSSMHQNPGPMMVVQPTQNLAKRWSKQRLAPMLDSTPVLQSLVRPARSRDSGNTTLMKEFPGGVLVVAGANSAVDLRSLPARDVFADEVDAYPEDVDGEGEPLTLAERRQSTFPRRKLFETSTPTIKDASVIERDFKLGDQRLYFVPCPHCAHKQVLRDENLQDDGTYLCEACGTSIEHHHKTWMLANGEWRAQNPEGKYPSFHISAHYSPVGLGYSWAEIAEERRKARASGDREQMQVYQNTICGLPYEDETGKIDHEDIRGRAGGYACRTIPPGCVILTAGVDVQDDRFAVQILGFGRGRRGDTSFLRVWVIDYFEIPADPALDEDWEKLDRELLDITFRNSCGMDLRIRAIAVDTGGHHTHSAYQYCRTRKKRLVLAIKGDRYPNKPIIAGRPRPQDVNTRGGVLRHGVDLWFVGADTAKGWIYSRLQADAQNEPGDYRISFPGDLSEDYFLQLTSERYDAKANRWRKINGRRNEALDTFVYGIAAAMHPSIRVHILKDADWDRIEQHVQPMIPDLFESSTPESVASSAQENDGDSMAKVSPVADALHQANRSRRKRFSATRW